MVLKSGDGYYDYELPTMIVLGCPEVKNVVDRFKEASYLLETIKSLSTSLMIHSHGEVRKNIKQPTYESNNGGIGPE